MTTPPASDGGLAAALDQLAEHAEELAGLRAAVTALTDLVDPDLGGGPPYRPAPAPLWWQLDGTDRDEAVARLASWVEKVYQPSYGRLAARLPGCWPQHPLCLFCLDWLCELHSFLYLRPARPAGVLSAQAEWHTRLLPAAADLMAQDTSGCEHRQPYGAVRSA